MTIRMKFLGILVILGICICVALIGVFSKSKTINPSKQRLHSGQIKNFNDDLINASTYWAHNKLGDTHFRRGDYDNAVNEYKMAIDIIENMPGENWTDVSKEEMGRINSESRNFDQIYSRYGLIEALEKAGRYEEALQNVEWLMKNQQMKGKEEFLKRRLEGMKQNLLQKMNDSKTE